MFTGIAAQGEVKEHCSDVIQYHVRSHTFVLELINDSIKQKPLCSGNECIPLYRLSRLTSEPPSYVFFSDSGHFKSKDRTTRRGQSEAQTRQHRHKHR